MIHALDVIRRVVVVSVTTALMLLKGFDDPRTPAPARVVPQQPRVPVSTTAPPTLPGSNHFVTLPVGAALPSDASCAASVRKVAEIRPQNASYNRAISAPVGPGYYARVTGNFSGTTDEIIQWAACKWGIDEDIVRAQAAKESGWFQQGRGDYGSDPSRCVPGHGIGVDGRPGQCPESIGMMQTRYPYMQAAFPMATNSTAYNLDWALAARRSCFEGNETWLNTVERGQTYGAGDIWGCVGLWFAGRWHTPDADSYTASVQQYLAGRIWETPGFLTWTPA